MSVIETHSVVCKNFRLLFERVDNVNYGLYNVGKIGYYFITDEKIPIPIPFKFCPFCGKVLH